jgi:hypothetical protein
MEALQQVPDPRRNNAHFPIGAVLSILAMALLSGNRALSSIHRFGQRLTQRQRALIRLPRKRGKRFYQAPGYKVYYRLLATLDNDAFAEVLSQWLREQSGTLPGALAVDGKMVRETIGVVSLVDHETGAPQAMALMSQKEGEGERCEMKVAERLIGRQPDVQGKVITGDALHAQKPTACNAIHQGGEYLVQVKGNRPKLHRHACKAEGTTSPLLPRTKSDTADWSAES